jgi:hypothetical protein
VEPLFSDTNPDRLRCSRMREVRVALGFFEDVDGGKSELHRVRCRVTPGDWLRLVTESATESRPPMALYKRTGKGERVR